MNNTLFGVDGMRKDALSHHGILGQKWGIRRYQNPDGSLTPEGQRRYLKEEARRYKKAQRKDAKIAKKEAKAEAALQKRKQEMFDSDNYKQFYKNRKLFSDKEIDAYIAKQQKEEQLRTAMRDHNNRLLDKASYGVERIAKVADTGVKAIDTYNKLAKIVNSVYGTEKLSKLDPESKKKEKMAKRRKSLMKLTPAEIMANYEKLDSDDIEYLSNRWKGLGTVGENYGKVEKIPDYTKTHAKSSDSSEVAKTTDSVSILSFGSSKKDDKADKTASVIWNRINKKESYSSFVSSKEADDFAKKYGISDWSSKPGTITSAMCDEELDFPVYLLKDK